MSAWKEWQIAVKNGDTERAEEARRDFESDCRREEAYDRMCEERDYYDYEHCGHYDGYDED